MILLNEPSIGKKEIKNVYLTIKNKWISSFGNYNKKFEKLLSQKVKSKNVIAVSSGTAALHLALRALNIKENEEIIVPSLTFVATVNVIRYVNAVPIFMDVGDDHNLDIDKTIEFLNSKTYFKNNSTYNSKSKKKISAIIIVHLWGNALNFEKLKKICKRKKIYIIEDAAEGLGTTYIGKKNHNKHVGTLGDIGCLSFNGNKIITTGSGGAVLTNSKKFAKTVIYLAEQAKDNSVKYIHNDIGYNYRLPNLNAAFGYGQLLNLNRFVKKRKFIHNYYCKHLNKLDGINVLRPVNYSNSNHWMNVLILDKRKIKVTPFQFHKKLLKKGIQSRLVWRPNHLQKKFSNMQKYKITKSNEIYNSCLCIPSSVDLSIMQLKKICYSINQIAKRRK